MPTENRSSNTEMVSVPRELLERIDRMYTDGMSVYGECEEIRAILAKRAEQHQGEPVAYRAAGNLFFRRRDAEDRAGSDPVTPLYTHADAGEVERLRLEIEQLRFSLEANDHEAVQDDCARAENRTLSDEVERLRAELAEMTKSYEALGELYAGTQKGFERLQAKLAERDALLDRLRNHLIAKDVLGNFGPELFQILNIEAPERASRMKS